ncbi:MAG: hypothetical protein HeimC3_12050 [Candidatus Heimdallarchaeota archaeon LC_3]|nr:MAG: hypothetical protein HeimC3_12050 [Candidatus Heimdallarchaeota archaeon LC_3]
MENKEVLAKILGSLERIENMLVKVNNRLELMESDKESHDPLSSLDIVNILQNIDENLIPTIRALFVLTNGGNAEEIAALTGRSRTRENQHLNKLSDLNYVEKIRKGREIKYQVKY